MNFSNFFIDMLSGNEPAISAGQKKAATPAFLFSDIMKVCEDENSSLPENTSTKSLFENSKEIFSTSDNVVDVEPQEFDTIAQLVAMIVNQSSEQQPNTITHSVDDAVITKQQFLVTENKLINLLSDLMDKGNSSLNPIINLLQSNESDKSISLSFKSGSNKLTVSFNPIKVDESYTNTVINDEYGFVNKLIVKEGFLNSDYEKLNFDSEAEKNSKSAEEENKVSDDVAAAIPPQIFFRAEILKIVGGSQENGNTVNEPVQKNNGTDFSKYFSFKYLTSENKPQVETQFLNIAAGENSPDINSAVIAVSEDKNREKSESGLLQKTNSNDVQTNKYVSSLSGIDISSSGEINTDSPVKSLSSLLEGLSEEEKSVFKNFASAGETKEVVYNKESHAQPNPEEINAGIKVESGNNINAFADKNLLKNELKTAQVQPADSVAEQGDAKAPDAAKAQLENETNSISIKPVIIGQDESNTKIKIETGSGVKPSTDQQVANTSQIKNETVIAKSVEQKLPGNANIKIKTETGSEVKPSTDQQVANTSQIKNETITEKNLEQELPVSKAKIFVKMNLKSASVSDAKNEILNTDTDVVTEENSDLSKKKVFDGKVISEPNLNDNVKLEAGTDSKKAEKQNQDLDVKISMKNPVKKEIELPEGNQKVEAKQQSDVEENLNHKSPVTSEKKIETNVDAADKIKISAKSGGTEKVEAAVQSDASAKLNAKDEKQLNGKDKVELKENSGDEAKTVKHSSQDQKSSFASDEESTKKNSPETFKTTLTNVVTSDFEVEKTKAFADVKTFHESVKIIKQNEIISEFTKLMQQGQKQTLTFQITPENLGKVKLTVDLVNNQIQTNIEVENEQVKQFIQTNIEQLKQNLQASGIQVNNLNISLSDYSQKSTGKMFAQKKKAGLRGEKEFTIEEVTEQPLKKMGYNTYEYLA